MVGMDRVTCSEFVRRLPDLIDGELDDELGRQLHAHVDHCARCMAKYRFERELIEGIRRKVAETRLPAGLADRIAAMIRAARPEAE